MTEKEIDAEMIWLINGEIHKLARGTDEKYCIFHYPIKEGVNYETFSVTTNPIGTREAALAFLLDYIQTDEEQEYLGEYLESFKIKEELKRRGVQAESPTC